MRIPENLYTQPIQESAKHHLQSFLDGEKSKSEALEEAMLEIRDKLEFALNTIAVHVMGDVNAERLPLKRLKKRQKISGAIWGGTRGRKQE